MNGALGDLYRLKLYHRSLKTLLMVEDRVGHLTHILKDIELRETLIGKLLSLCDAFGLDGIVLDWRFPGIANPQTQCAYDEEVDATHLLDLLVALRTRPGIPMLYMTLAGGLPLLSYLTDARMGIPLANMSRYVDAFLVQTDVATQDACVQAATTAIPRSKIVLAVELLDNSTHDLCAYVQTNRLAGVAVLDTLQVNQAITEIYSAFPRKDTRINHTTYTGLPEGQAPGASTALPMGLPTAPPPAVGDGGTWTPGVELSAGAFVYYNNMRYRVQHTHVADAGKVPQWTPFLYRLG